MRILVIEDDSSIRKMMCKILSAEGYDVFEAENGSKGLKLLKSENEIDVVITDIIMPEKEGIETIIEMNRDFPNIKILAISGGGKGSAFDYLSLAKSIGADLTMTKPFVKNDLLEAVKSLGVTG